jgi:hypothetical protein
MILDLASAVQHIDNLKPCGIIGEKPRPLADTLEPSPQARIAYLPFDCIEHREFDARRAGIDGQNDAAHGFNP